MFWLKQHPRLYGFIGVMITICAALATIQGVGGLFTNEPLVPLIVHSVSIHLEWQKILFVCLGGLITIAGIVFLVFLFRMTRTKREDRAAQGISDDTAGTNIRTRIEAVDQSAVIWGLWYTGAGMRMDRLFKGGKIRRILLWNPSAKNQNIEENANVVDSKPNLIRSEIELVRDEIVRYNIPYRYYNNFRAESFTIYDPAPTQNEIGEFIPNSDNAWICTQHPTSTLRSEQWPRREFKNNGNDKKVFGEYFRLFEDIWSNKSVAPEHMERPFQTTNGKPVQEERQKAQLNSDIGLLIIEGADVLRGFKSVKTFGDAWPEQEFKVWREKVYATFTNYKLNDYYALFFKDTCIDISQAILSDYTEACEAGLKRLEELLKRLT